MIYLKLFYSFFKIGLFSFGGGYAMIPLIESEISANGWITHNAFIQIIGISQMTPGPIAVNTATFVGYQTAGILGAAMATLGVATPSLLIILFISSFFFRNAKHPIMRRIFYGIRPVVAGLIFSAVIIISRTTIIDAGETELTIQPVTLVVAIIVLVLIIKTKIHPIILIIGSGILGYIMSLIS